MAQNIAEVFSNFSQKLARFNKSPDAVRTPSPEKAKTSYYEEKLREQGEKLRLSVCATYKIYRAPFEALGEQSDRAASIDRDELSLLKAYNLFKSCMDIDKENRLDSYQKCGDFFADFGQGKIYFGRSVNLSFVLALF